jgi:heat shock protein HtpX
MRISPWVKVFFFTPVKINSPEVIKMNNIFKTTFLLSLLSILLVAMGGAVGGQGGMMVALLMAAVMNFGSYWFSDKIVLRMYNAQEITRDIHPSFYGMIERLAARAGLPMPRVYIIPDDSPNAFATGRNPDHAAVAATEGILRILTPEELEGVMAHELAHVKNRDILISTIAATFAGAISMIGSMLQWGAMFGAGRGDDEGGGGIGGMMALFSTHPPMEERISRLESLATLHVLTDQQ